MPKQIRYDVAVVGAGAFGAWSAYFLRQQGRKIALLDAYGPGHSRSSSGGETRIMRMGYGADELYTRFAVRSMDLWQDLFRRTGENLFVRTGMLWLARKQDRYPLASLEILTRLGVPCEKLSRSETGKRFSQFSLNEADWTLFEPNAGIILARRAVQTAVCEALADGVEYIGEAVQRPSKSSRVETLVTTTGRKITAESYVFACGAWLPRIFPATLGQHIFPSRQEIFFFAPPAGSSQYAPPAMPAWYSFADNVYGIPDIQNRGVKIGFDTHGHTFDPETRDRIVSQRGLRAMRGLLRKHFPELRDAPLAESRVCAYENTSNGDFLIDRHPAFENVWMVGGGSGHGFKHSPAVGEYVARLLAGSTQPEPRFSYTSKAMVKSRQVY
jgi:sarcosine oxidase